MTNVIPISSAARRWDEAGTCRKGHDITKSENVILVKRPNGAISRLCRACTKEREQRYQKPVPLPKPSTGTNYLDHQQLSDIARKLTNSRPGLTEFERETVADVLRRVANGLRRAESIPRHPVWRHRRQEALINTLRQILGNP